LASIKVSELPAVTAITANDVLIINDENLTTSNITITNFTSSFIAQDLAITGNVSFASPVTFLTASVPNFQTSVTFGSTATFNGPIVLGALAEIPLGSLSNVTLPATIPTGNVLTWNQTAGYWENATPFSNVLGDTTPTLGGNLNVNGYQITTGGTVAGPGSQDIDLVPVGTGRVTVFGNATTGSGTIVLNCEANSHGIKFQGPPHSAAASYTFILPNTMGTSGQVLKTDGTSQTSWTTLTATDVGAATAAQGTLADSAVQVNGTNSISAYADDTAAAAGGVPVGGLYRIGNAVQIRLA